MSVDIEEMLERELREVADVLRVPPPPALPDEAPRHRRQWHALLVAAVVLLVVACAVAVEAIGGGDREPEPAPVPPTISRAAPTTPYVLGQRLYVGGERVPGDWWSVEHGRAGWVAQRSDDTWWWGRDAEAFEIERLSGVPVISPNGRYVAAVDDERGVITGFDTADGAEGFGEVPIELGDPARTGDPVHVRAVTDDGRVVAQGAAASVLWLPLVDGSTVDLTASEPDAWILGNTPAGVVVTEGVDGAPYLADLTDTGDLTGLGELPSLDSFEVSPQGRRLAWTSAGSLGGEVTALSWLEAQRVDGREPVRLTAPDGWAFRVGTWSWEDDDHLVSVVVRDDGAAGERLVRCSVEVARCVLVDSP